MASKRRVIVIGAGVGGLTTAAALARAGLDVTVLEAHIYPGGCAGTFYHQGFRFDAGATLAGGFIQGGAMESIARVTGIKDWPVRPSNIALVVHLPNGQTVERRTGHSRWEGYEQAFGPAALPFFRWQEATADAVWPLAVQGLPWPPQGLTELKRMARLLTTQLFTDRLTASAELLMAAGRSLAAYLPRKNPSLRSFIDGQLLISAQTTSDHANALFAAAALDLPRRGIVEVEGGMGGIARTLEQALLRSGGQIHYRQRASQVRFESARPVAVETQRGVSYPTDAVIFNLPASDIRRLLPEGSSLQERLPVQPPSDGWGAFTLYLGVDGALLPPDFPLHHQLLTGDSLGEGDSLFLSLSPRWDSSRAPAGMRAITVSTHTARNPWWHLFQNDRPAYEARKLAYQERLVDRAEELLPGLQSAVVLQLPGTPVTFRRFTHRTSGWVGGFPQTNLLRTRGPRLGQDMWMVGESIFPGQSTTAIALGGLRVAGSVLGNPNALFQAIEPESLSATEIDGWAGV